MVAVPAGARDRLERLCRYVLRPAVGQDRVQVSREGQVVLDLRRRWPDGTTQLVFDPVEFLERLAALVPRPKINLVLYYGVLAPRAAWREAVVPSSIDVAQGLARRDDAGEAELAHQCLEGLQRGPGGRAGRRPSRTWAELMQRSFGFDVLACPRCTGRMVLVALIRQPAVVARILEHLGLPTHVPVPRPGREPPLAWEVDSEPTWAGVE